MTLKELDFELLSLQTNEELIKFSNDNNLDLYVDKNSPIDLLVADIRVSFCIKYDLCSFDKSESLERLNQLKLKYKGI